MAEEYIDSPVLARVAAIEAIWRRVGAQLTHEAAADAARQAEIDLLKGVAATNVRLSLLGHPEKVWKESMHAWLELPSSAVPTLLEDVAITGYREGIVTTYALVETTADKPTRYLVPMSSVTEISVTGHQESDLR